MPNETDLSLNRRHLLRLGALAGAAGTLGLPHNTASADEAAFAEAVDYLSAAREAARWVRSAESREGGVWLPEPDHPKNPRPYPCPMVFTAAAPE